uniref:Uncharacterized protein n=1 Tax=Sarcophilus harrisii TaxID=9305 RepID=A0A7N4PQE1_SARHA
DFGGNKLSFGGGTELIVTP